MARTRGPNARGKSRGGGTAASVAVPRRSARIAGTAGSNQTVSTHEDDGASSRAPPRPAHSRSPSCQGSPQSQSAASPLPCSSPKSLLPAPRQSESSLPRKPPVPSRPPFLLPTPLANSLVPIPVFSRVSSLLPNSVSVSISFSPLKAVCWLYDLFPSSLVLYVLTILYASTTLSTHDC